MTQVFIPTELLRSLAAGLDGQHGTAAQLRDIARQGVSVGQVVEAQGMDAFDVISASSRLRGIANTLGAEAGPLRAVADWLDVLERSGGIAGAPPRVPSFGLGAVSAVTFQSGDAAFHGITGGSLVSQLGFNPPPTINGDTISLPPSGDSPGHDLNYENFAAKLESYGPGGEYGFQCTAWANFRWRQLGYTGPALYGNGNQVAADEAAKQGIAPASEPSLGALASVISAGGRSENHVMVVESVTLGSDGQPSSFTVSEANMNYDANASTWGTTDTFVRTAEGWTSAKHYFPSPVTIQFAPFPKPQS